MPYENGKVKKYKNTTDLTPYAEAGDQVHIKRGMTSSPRPKPRPEYMNKGVGGTVDLSPTAEAGDQFFVQEAMRNKQKATKSKQ